MKIQNFCLLLLFSITILTGCNKDTTIEIADFNEKTAVEDTTEYNSMKELSRQSFGYMRSINDEIIYDSENLELPGYVDVLSFSKHISDDDVYFYVELRDIPNTFLINQEGLSSMQFEYSWRINFDTNLDNDVSYDVTVAHHKFRGTDTDFDEVAIQHESFENVILQQQVSSDYQVSDFDFSIDGNTMVFHFMKNQNEELMAIHEETPFHILTEYKGKNMYLYELIPINE